MNKITAHSLDIISTPQKLDLPVGTTLLSINVDHRFNKCLLWARQDDEAHKMETVTFAMVRLGDAVPQGDYIGTLKDNSGYVHVFADGQKRPDAVTATARLEREKNLRIGEVPPHPADLPLVEIRGDKSGVVATNPALVAKPVLVEAAPSVPVSEAGKIATASHKPMGVVSAT